MKHAENLMMSFFDLHPGVVVKCNGQKFLTMTMDKIQNLAKIMAS